MNEIGEADYTFWRDEFSRTVREYGETIRGIGGWDELTHIKYEQFILTILGHISNKEILDVGGGVGMIPSKLAKHNQVYNLDISEEQLERSMKYGILPILGNAITLPFKDESFDYVLCISVIHYLRRADRLKLLNELMRVCKSKGLIFISTPNKAALARKTVKLFKLKSIVFKHNNKPSPNYLSLREFISYLIKLKGYEIYAIFLIVRPLRDFVIFTTSSIDIVNSSIAQWLCTDSAVVIMKHSK
jgi:2-polyprenyl-3-methyl-5-hydroxy-6-metoxy-1,4-benzoquinol methylase